MAKGKGPFKLFPNGKDNAIKLTPEELAEFMIRQQSLNVARCQFAMIEESYTTWVNVIKTRYGLTAQFDIDLEDGTLLPKEPKEAVPNA